MLSHAMKPVRGIARVWLLPMNDGVPITALRRVVRLRNFMRLVAAGEIKIQARQRTTRCACRREQHIELRVLNLPPCFVGATFAARQWHQTFPMGNERKKI